MPEVWITQRGRVYHEDPQCPRLLSGLSPTAAQLDRRQPPRAVPLELVIGKRRPCNTCAGIVAHLRRRWSAG